MSTSLNNTLNNLNLILTKDLGEDQQITLNTFNKVGLSLDYNKLTSVKTFALNEDGITYTSGTTSFNTPLERLCALKTALSAVELPSETTTLALNKNIKLNQTSDNNVIVDEASNNIAYPFTNPVSDFQTRITKQTDDNLEIGHLQNIHLRKNVTPTYNINNLNISYSTKTTSTNLNFNATTGTSCSTIFPNIERIAYAVFNVSNKVLYIESYTTPNTYITVNLNSLTTGSTNYSGDLSSIGIAQIVPVYYNSNTDAKFYIRLQQNSAGNNIYIITCQGDPSLLTSYTYSTNYLQCNTGTILNQITNNTTCLVGGQIPSIVNGGLCCGQRTGIIMYDNVNDLFILANNGGTTTTLFYTVVNTSLTRSAAYNIPLPTGYGSILSSLISSTYTTPCITRIFNNGAPTSGASRFVGSLHNVFWNSTSYTLTRSNYIELADFIPLSYFYTNSNFDAYTIPNGEGLNTYLPIRVQTAVYPSTEGQDLYLGCVNWNKTTNAPTLLFNKYIESAGINSFYSVQHYPSLYVRTINDIELFSTFSANFYVSSDAMTTKATYFQSGYIGSNTVFNNVEQVCMSVTNKMSINYPVHAIYKSNNSSIVNTLNIFSVTNQLQKNSTDYLTFDYDLTSNTGTISSTKPMTLSANPLTITSAGFTNLPTCSVVPTLGDQLVNKTYVDGLGGTPSLSSVLAIGNSTGTYDIDVNDKSLLNVSSITSTVDLSLNPTGSIVTNGKTLDMTNGQIHKCPLIHGPNNTNFVIEAQGTGELQLKSNGVNRVTIDSNGATTFLSSTPLCSITPSTSDGLTNKGYVDGAITTASSGYVKTTGNETISGIKTFSSLPESSISASSSNQLTNKNYVDSAITTASAGYVKTTGNETISGIKTFSNIIKYSTSTPPTPSANEDLITVGYGNTAYANLSGVQTFTGVKTFNRLSLLKLQENLVVLAGSTSPYTVSYTSIEGSIYLIDTPPSTNFQLNINNIPTTELYGVYTFTLLINAGTNKTYASTIQVGGVNQTIRFNGGTPSGLTSAVYLLQSITLIKNNTSTVSACLSSVSQWY